MICSNAALRVPIVGLPGGPTGCGLPICKFTVLVPTPPLPSSGTAKLAVVSPTLKVTVALVEV